MKVFATYQQWHKLEGGLVFKVSITEKEKLARPNDWKEFYTDQATEYVVDELDCVLEPAENPEVFEGCDEYFWDIGLVHRFPAREVEIYD